MGLNTTKADQIMVVWCRTWTSGGQMSPAAQARLNAKPHPGHALNFLGRHSDGLVVFLVPAANNRPSPANHTSVM